LVKGKVVLLAHSVPPDSLPLNIREDYFHKYRNACFDIEKIGPYRDSWAGIIRIGMVGWYREPDDSLVRFSLYWSPDARYWVKVKATGGHLYGHGHSDGPEFHRSYPLDSVYAERVGPANESTCIAAASGRR
jgi:hypothetical protein